MAEPMFRFHTFVQTRLAGTTLAGTSNDGLVILQMIFNRKPLKLKYTRCDLSLIPSLTGGARVIGGSVELPTCISKVLVVGDPRQKQSFQFKHSEGAERNGEKNSGGDAWASW